MWRRLPERLVENRANWRTFEDTGVVAAATTTAARSAFMLGAARVPRRDQTDAIAGLLAPPVSGC